MGLLPSSTSVDHMNLVLVNRLLVSLTTLSEETFLSDEEEALTLQAAASLSTVPVKLTALLLRLYTNVSSINTKNVFTVVLMSFSIL